MENAIILNENLVSISAINEHESSGPELECLVPQMVRIPSVKTDSGYETHFGVPVKGEFYTRTVSRVEELLPTERASLILYVEEMQEKLDQMRKFLLPDESDDIPDSDKMKLIVQQVARARNIPVKELYIRTKERLIVEPRQICMYVAKQVTRLSLAMISEHFGGREHTTAMHSIKTVKNLMDTDERFKREVMFYVNLNYKKIAEREYSTVVRMAASKNMTVKAAV